MSVFGNGKRVVEEPTYIKFIDSASAGAAETISINEPVAFEAEMEQITVHWGAVPGISGDLTLTKTSIEGAKYHTVLRKIDPSGLGDDPATTDWVCVCPFRWNTGDSVTIDYSNPSNIDVGVEIKLKKV